jgi:hypothetical protein
MTPVAPETQDAPLSLATLPTEILTAVFEQLPEHGDFYALADVCRRMCDIAREPAVLQTHLQQNGLAVPTSRGATELRRILSASAKWPIGVYRLTTSTRPSTPASPQPAPAPTTLQAAVVRSLGASKDGRWTVELEANAQRSQVATLKLLDTTRPNEPGEVLGTVKNPYNLSALVSRGARTVMLQAGATHQVFIRAGGAREAVSLEQVRLERRGCCAPEVGIGSAGASMALSPSGRFAVLDSVGAEKWEFWDLRRLPLKFTVEKRPALGATLKLAFLDDESGFVATGARQQVSVDFKPPAVPPPLFTWPLPSPWASALRAGLAEPIAAGGARRLERLARRPRHEVTYPREDGILHFRPRYSPDGRWALDYRISGMRERGARNTRLFKLWDLTGPQPIGRPLFTLRERESIQDFGVSNGARTVLIRTFEHDLLFLRQNDAAGAPSYGVAELPDDTGSRSRWACDALRSVAVAPSGRLAVTHNDCAKQAVIWDLSHGSAVSISPPVGVPRLHALSHMAFSPTEDSIVLEDDCEGVRIELS